LRILQLNHDVLIDKKKKAGSMAMKKIKKISIMIIAICMLVTFVPHQFCQEGLTIVEAHSGRTDSSGGHRDNKNASGLGYYHYHCGGNPPHLHSNGVCPYSAGSSSNDSTSSNGSNTAKKVSINKKKTTLIIGKQMVLKVKNSSGKIKWRSSNNKVATVSGKGKVVAKKAGKATITAKTGGKTLKCKVTVKRQYPKIKTLRWNPHGNNLYLQIKNTTKRSIKIYPELKSYDDDYKYFASMFLNGGKPITIASGKTATVCFSGDINHFKVTDYIQDYYNYQGLYNDAFDYKKEAYGNGIIWFTQKFTFSLLVNGETLNCRAEYTEDDYIPYVFSFK